MSGRALFASAAVDVEVRQDAHQPRSEVGARGVGAPAAGALAHTSPGRSSCLLSARHQAARDPIDLICKFEHLFLEADTVTSLGRQAAGVGFSLCHPSDTNKLTPCSLRVFRGLESATGRSRRGRARRRSSFSTTSSSQASHLALAGSRVRTRAPVPAPRALLRVEARSARNGFRLPGASPSEWASGLIVRGGLDEPVAQGPKTVARPTSSCSPAWSSRPDRLRRARAQPGARADRAGRSRDGSGRPRANRDAAQRFWA